MPVTKSDTRPKKNVDQVENLQRKVKEALEQRWVSMAALSSAILAVLAALTGVSATSHGNRVTRDLIRNSDQWSFYQAKGIKATMLQTKVELLESLKHPISEHDQQKLKEYRLEQNQISETAKEQESSIEYHLKVSGLFSRGMTFFQIAIGLIAVSLLTKKMAFWLAGLGLALVGVVFAVQGVLI